MKLLLLPILFYTYAQAAALTLSGVVISDNQKIITSRNMGYVTSVNVSEGSRVNKGDLLYTIDSKEIDSAKTQTEMSLSQTEISLQTYQNQYENVKLNLERHRRLYAQDLISKYELENIELAEKNLKNTIKITERQLKQAKARQDEVSNQYRYLRVTAPNNGVVITKNIKVGEMAMPGTPAIILSDLSTLKIEVEIAESNLKIASVGKKVKISIPSIAYTTVGTITSIIPNSNPMTHTFKMKISFKGGKTIYPGMYATIELS